MDKADLIETANFIYATEENQAQVLPKCIFAKAKLLPFSQHGLTKAILTFHRKWSRELRYDESVSKGEDGPEFFSQEGVRLFRTELTFPYHASKGGSGRGDASGYEIWLIAEDKLALFRFREEEVFDNAGASLGADETIWEYIAHPICLLSFDSEGRVTSFQALAP